MVSVTLDTKGWLDVFPALENVNRFNILIMLYNKGQQSFTEIGKEHGLTDGNLAHHLNMLLERELIKNAYITPSVERREYSFYELTDKGKMVLERILE